MDVAKYFQNIDKQILYNILCRKIKDENFISNTNFNQESQNSKPFFLSGTSNSKMDTFSHIASGFGN